tara:strand:- start:17808 stop:18395 length:588 start_codon:yes stop_codon:yes gene_type:complete
MLFSRRKTYQKLTDEELILLYKKEQVSLIIGELFSRYGHLVLGVSMKYSKNKQDAEDITMTVFEKLPARIIRSDINNFKSWLYTVTKNEVFQLFRKKGVDKIELTPESENYRIEQDNSIENVIIKDAQLIKLESLIDTLKDHQKKCILLFYIERKSYQEISKLLSMEIKSIKSAIQNGKRNLKIKLENCEEFKQV